ncbi:MAG: hypothetical protein ABS62_09815 [Microbacterium sp. SCN 70-200]|uniref:type II toxin-antitoxin system VapC family toxin n=1 Tax=unclassified Microbacterium TaxID=2609290 RepID=UPI00086D3724|nr:MULTISPECIES: type II toxin-antitoxin system VapC family toxin [unclassified Microbacterium]MBN9213424.1 type II toxin-antitoxin system VapC family toxin [Microbacterium sp.]ODT40474.1 MAG: hypothetical protein ABS62_09815 [Microbacterium sp. SCN 70-200]OJV85057.1 MAG: hypothetical protein BGO46_10765 [Microbacterium sp. 70-16]
MIVYFDTSAFFPLLVEESGSAAALRLWRDSTARVSSRLIIVEAAAAIGMGLRLGRLTAADYEPVREDAWRYATNMILVDVSASVIDEAADLAVTHSLRGYDAMHLATALLFPARDLVFASGDRRLLDAAGAAGFTVVYTARSGA